MNATKLQISIIAKNHPHKFLECLDRILPQLDIDCILLLFFDGNTAPMEPILERVATIPNVKLVHQKKAIGYEAASLRIVEYSQYQWLWTIKDIDLPEIDAISLIRKTVANLNENTGLIKFETKQDFSLKKSNLNKAMLDDNFAVKLALFSTSVYYKPGIPTLQPAYKAISSQACHAIIAMDYLKHDHNLKCISQKIFECIGDTSENQLEFEAAFERASIFLDYKLTNKELMAMQAILGLYHKISAREALKEACNLKRQKNFNHALLIYTEFVWNRLLQKNTLSQKILHLIYYFRWRLTSKLHQQPSINPQNE